MLMRSNDALLFLRVDFNSCKTNLLAALDSSADCMGYQGQADETEVGKATVPITNSLLFPSLRCFLLARAKRVFPDLLGTGL